MYARDVPRIKEWAEASPEAFASLCTFVLVTIRQPFQTVPQAMRDVRQRGAESNFLWGWKREGFEYVDLHKNDLFGNIFGANVVQTIDILASEVPGFGIVKAAFVAQMLGHNVACMDVSNLEKLGTNARSFREFKRRYGQCVVKPETRERRILDYIQLTVDTGGAEFWWDDWCNRIGARIKQSGDEISRWHWRSVSGVRL